MSVRPDLHLRWPVIGRGEPLQRRSGLGGHGLPHLRREGTFLSLSVIAGTTVCIWSFVVSVIRMTHSQLQTIDFCFIHGRMHRCKKNSSMPSTAAPKIAVCFSRTSTRKSRRRCVHEIALHWLSCKCQFVLNSKREVWTRGT